MLGEKPTSKALQPAWQGTHTQTDGIQTPHRRRVVVIGVGRVGNNTVTQLTKTGTADAYTVAINTDPLHLNKSQADKKILINPHSPASTETTPPPNRASVEETQTQIEETLADADIVFITADLDSETGAVSAIAEIAKKGGATTLGVVTTSHRTEKGRSQPPSKALTELQHQCDTVVVVDINELTELASSCAISEAWGVAGQTLAHIIGGMVEMISSPSLIDLDLDHFRSVVKGGRLATVGIGESNAPNRAEEALHNALKSPSLDINLGGATGALIHVTGDAKMTAEDANRAGEILTEMMNEDAHVVWGAKVSPELDGRIRVTLVMTGVNSPDTQSWLGSIAPQLFNLESYSEPEHPDAQKTPPLDLSLYQLENFES